MDVGAVHVSNIFNDPFLFDPGPSFTFPPFAAFCAMVIHLDSIRHAGIMSFIWLDKCNDLAATP
jgi:hypothetical protein